MRRTGCLFAWLARWLPLLVASFLIAPPAYGYQSDSVPGSSAAPEVRQRWGHLADLPGSTWQYANGQIVSYSWQIFDEVLLTVDLATQTRHTISRRDDGTLIRSPVAGGTSHPMQVNPDGSVVDIAASRTQRQTHRLRGDAIDVQFEYQASGAWLREPRYDWTKWRLTDAQVATAVTRLAASPNRSGTARQLLQDFRGAAAIAQGDSRAALHREAVRRETVGRRVALVIGIGTYGEIGNLANSVNDARAIADALRNVGFDVEAVIDPDQRSMRAAIQRLGDRMDAAGRGATGLFYFAGHGMQSQGANYLIPAGANIRREADLELEAVPADVILLQMEDAQSSTNILILDACRNMPLARSFRSGSGGLAQMNAPDGSFIAYSTAPGATAADGSGAANSPFAAALLQELGRPATPIESMFRNVRRAVVERTGGMQTPWDSSSLTEPFLFVP